MHTEPQTALPKNAYTTQKKPEKSQYEKNAQSWPNNQQ
jgi:hypothetical protein